MVGWFGAVSYNMPDLVGSFCLGLFMTFGVATPSCFAERFRPQIGKKHFGCLVLAMPLPLKNELIDSLFISLSFNVEISSYTTPEIIGEKARSRDPFLGISI